MPRLKNSEEKYGWLAQTLHWLIAVLIIGMLCVGLYMETLPLGPDKLKLYGLHKSTGIVILFLVFLRVTWRQFNTQPEVPEHGKWTKLLRFASKSTHWMIYILMFTMPLTGWAMSSGKGFPVSVYGLFTMPNLIGPDKGLSELLKTIHQCGAYVLIALLCLHIAAALFHHFILKDVVLRRMLPLVLLLAATPAFAAAPEFTLDKAKSSIKFEAVQNGAPVTGEFKDFDAKIIFSPDDLAASSASADVKIGSVSSSYDEMVSTLKTADWFDADKFPDAKFEVSNFVFEGTDKSQLWYAANGHLTVKGINLPLTLHFKLAEYDAKHAIMDGTATIKRTDYKVGWKDVSAVKDDVKVTVHVEAVR